MPKIPAPTVSQMIPSQIPEFVREDYPVFVAFMQAYYEWLETSGYTVLTGKAISADVDTLVLPSTASSQNNRYKGYNLFINNGPAAGQMQVIDWYDGATRTCHLVDLWKVAPVPFSNFSIRDDNHPSKILEYADVDTTVDEFADFFKSEFLRQIPGNILADKALVLKHIRSVYKARGAEKSFKFLFRILFNEDVEFFYPKLHIFRSSAGKWYAEKIIRITSSSNTFDWVNRTITGATSGATAYVESVKQFHLPGISTPVSELELTNITGEFYVPNETDQFGNYIYPPEEMYISELSPPPTGSLADPTTVYKIDDLYRIVTDVTITDSGDQYRVGDIIDIVPQPGYPGAPATAIVSTIYEEIQEGFAQDPPASVYLEPFFEFRSGGNTNGVSVVSGDGSTMVTGDPSYGGSQGAVEIYKFIGGDWILQEIVTPVDNTGIANFGYSVAISFDGTTVAIGGPHDDNNHGATWVWILNNGVWQQQAKLIGAGTSTQQGAGVSLSTDGNTLFIDDVNGTVWTYIRSMESPEFPVGMPLGLGETVAFWTLENVMFGSPTSTNALDSIGTLFGDHFFMDVELVYTGTFIGADQIVLSDSASNVDDYYTGDQIVISAGTGNNQERNIISYDGLHKVATVDVPWVVWPDHTSYYQIIHARGKIKTVQVTEFGAGFTATPLLTFNTSTGSSATGYAVLGPVGTYPGRWLDDSSQTDATQRFEDDYYWQDFSYVLRIGESVDKYKNVVKALLHPAGTKMFGEVLVKSKPLSPNAPILNAVKELIIKFETQAFQLSLQDSTSTTLIIDPTGDPVATTTNDTIDRFKCTAFGPNPSMHLSYPFANQDYWSGPANTPIGSIPDHVTIGDFINNPNAAAPFTFETFMRIETDRSVNLVGPIGPSFKSLDRTKGTPIINDVTIPIFEPETVFTDTPISVFADQLISSGINGTTRTDLVPDSFVTIIGARNIPEALYNIGQFDCMEVSPSGLYPLDLRNISPSSYDQNNGILLTGSPVINWTSFGLHLNGSGIDLSALPVDLAGQSIIMVARMTNLPVGYATLISSTNSVNENGYSIELSNSGVINCRARMGSGNGDLIVSPGSVRRNGWFAVMMKFDGSTGVMTCRLNALASKQGSFASWGINPPTPSSNGWFVGTPGYQYPGSVGSSATFGHNAFSKVMFGQQTTAAIPIPTSNFVGDIAYVIMYRRPIYSYEFNSIYSFLKPAMAARRINLP